LKNKLNKLKEHPKYDTVLNWGKLISITGSAQLIVQVVGFTCGILIVRLLPVQEYAFYTLANTMLGTMTVLSDGGISTGVMSQGGKVWQDKDKLGVVLATGLHLRRKFSVWSLAVAVPILFYLLIHNNASWLTAFLITASLIPAFYAALSDSLLEIVPKLHQSILPLQKNQVAVGTGRLLLTSLTMFIFPWAFIAVLAAGLPRIWGNIQLRKIVYGLADKKLKMDKVVQTEVLSIVKRRMPESIYYCLSGQINIWLISIFGTTAALASLGALGRFSMITSLFLVMFSTLIVPRFARFANDRRRLRNKALSVIAVLFVLCFFIISIAFIFSNQFLWILGESYYGLNQEFILIISAGCLSMFQGVFFSINSAKGWIISPILYILVSISTTVLSLFLVDISTLEGVIIFKTVISLIQAIVLISYCFYRISKL
jgi:O-antigen/teichoic acid export membrane protein